MNEDFWINIVKVKSGYMVETWSVNEDRILFVERKRMLTLWGAKRYGRKIIINHMIDRYIKEKI
jgi:hypothetical protein